jgi:hypothetical protein
MEVRAHSAKYALKVARREAKREYPNEVVVRVLECGQRTYRVITKPRKKVTKR